MNNLWRNWGSGWIILGLIIGFGSDDKSFLAQNPSKCPAIFNFGDSNSDTGAYSATFARVPHPYGSTFFGHPSGRLSNGRIFIDFVAEKLGLPYLNAYLDAISSDFKHGANFAVALGTLKPADGKLYGYGVNPISLNLQLLQFRQFKDRVEELHKRDETSVQIKRLPRPEDFSKALYTIDIGANDLSLLVSVSSEDQALKSLPELIGIFSNAIEELYELGARRFLIINTGPLGCLPTFVTLFASKRELLDEAGCVKSYNNVAKEFNRLLMETVSRLQNKFNDDSSILHVDMYSAKFSLFQNANQLGFIDPHGYCCKECVKFYVPIWQRDVSNNTVSYKSCDDPSKYISWDGSHYTEAANHLVANRLFNTSFNTI